MNKLDKRIEITLSESKRLFEAMVGLKYEEEEKELAKTILLEIKMLDKKLVEIKEKKSKTGMDELIVSQIASVVEKGFIKYKKLKAAKED